MLIPLLVLLIAIAPISMLIHESGHVLMALIFRSDRSEIFLGSGKRVYTFIFKNVRLHLHQIIFFGAYSINEKVSDFSNKQKALISIAGPCLNGGVALFIFTSPWKELSTIFLLFGWFNLYLAVTNSFPFHFKGRKSDGFRFFEYFIS